LGALLHPGQGIAQPLLATMVAARSRQRRPPLRKACGGTFSSILFQPQRKPRIQGIERRVGQSVLMVHN
jgi:hypothetical protein